MTANVCMSILEKTKPPNFIPTTNYMTAEMVGDYFNVGK